MKWTTKDITLTGMGIALFVALSMCLRVPVFENYYLCLGYIVMAVYCYSCGIVKGTIVGTVGTILYCILINGLRGMPGWALGNIIIGIILGLTFRICKNIKNKFLGNVICIISIVIATLLAILGVKSVVECLLYSQPFLVRVASNMYAFIADIVVLCVSVPICKIVDLHIKGIYKSENNNFVAVK